MTDREIAQEVDEDLTRAINALTAVLARVSDEECYLFLNIVEQRVLQLFDYYKKDSG